MGFLLQDKRILRIVSALLMALAANGYAVTYQSPIDDSRWYLSASIFGCSLTHTIPGYGEGVFFREAGEPLQFYLQTKLNSMQQGQAAIVIESPPWQPGVAPRDLGYVPVEESSKPIVVERLKASHMMASLMDGLSPSFTRKAIYSDETIRVRLNSVNFKPLYDDYMSCVSTLLPVNFRQVERSLVLFEVDKAILTKDDIAVLDKVILYVKADNTVNGINVDGHTDSSGRRIYNRRLSKDRAEVVTKYLLDNGISADLITSRYHGERYPAVSNKNKKDRERNRRTTIRLERGDKSPVRSTPEDEYGDSQPF